ncbi:T9SS type A sorting domain-containing protein [Polaribacter sp. HL-MS24]|uniref:T9SS type A sorting domain-containing protein n=1 Tax=Polaribacter sp. HL-MS24 TaxID=3077735 RepID=UPI0029351E42|nr:T9SS type A sorting domain-containing protein [Polaribacter sp. HL-MS24]WOC39954.1 T9SS type A sorting domain-containing protein [Polaribacter sp. HL-MS24]
MQKIIRLVETKDNTVNISIYNFTGERVLNKNITNAKETISLSKLRSGIHFVKTTMKGLTETKTIYLLR